MMEGSHPRLDVSLAAQRRDAVPTLPEVMAAMPMRTLPEGGLVPADMPLVSGDPDGDRDSVQAAELARLVRDMDVMCDAVIGAYSRGAAVRLASQWQAIRRITQANQPTGVVDES